MYNVAVIGAGQLGSRHLQGLVRLEVDCRFFVVDPTPQSLQSAQARVEETGVAVGAGRISYHRSLAALPDQIDYAVVATAADVRLAILQALLPGRTIRNLVLEKVLFQRVDDYLSALALIQATGTNVWVNCPRRAFPLYQEIREFFEDHPLLQFQVHGGNWGLGCNSIHFLDLLAFLTGGIPDGFSTADLDRRLTASKRPNFYEFTGSLRGNCGTALFEITSLPRSSMALLIVLRSEGRSCVIDETGGKALFYDSTSPEPWTQSSFRNPFVSELSTSIARDALVMGRTALTPFEDSVAYHLPLIKALGAHTAEILSTPPDYCPIT